ncbi:MAG: alpha/beta hydrolase family protein [Steroidobacteraceae bacterium]|jgi:pimeloyl-ACP methyl ester carboxylesterase
MAIASGIALGSGARASPEESEALPSGEAEQPASVIASRQQNLSVPVIDAQGRVAQLKTRVCRPAIDAPEPLVIINHGSPPNSSERPKMQLGRCEHEAAQWFLARGFVVAFVLRRGYGETGGTWAEDQGGCDYPNYLSAGVETARDIDAVVNYVTALPYVRRDSAVVVGQSAGGWGAIAYDSLPHPKVGAFVVMAAGRGGHRHNQPNDNCRADLLIDAARRFGAHAATPMLWVYSANDSYFAPPIARAMWHAFTAAGGRADLEQPGPYGTDGHRLFFGPHGSSVWGPLVERYLAAQGIAAN